MKFHYLSLFIILFLNIHKTFSENVTTTFYFRNDILNCNTKPGCKFTDPDNWENENGTNPDFSDENIYIVTMNDQKTSYIYSENDLISIGTLSTNGNLELTFNGSMLFASNIGQSMSSSIIYIDSIVLIDNQTIVSSSSSSIVRTTFTATDGSWIDSSSKFSTNNSFLVLRTSQFDATPQLDINSTLSGEVAIFNKGIVSHTNTTIIVRNITMAGQFDIANLLLTDTMTVLKNTKVEIDNLSTLLAKPTIIQKEKSKVTISQFNVKTLTGIYADDDADLSLTSSNTADKYEIQDLQWNGDELTLDMQFVKTLTVTNYSNKINSLTLLGNTTLFLNGDLLMDDKTEISLKQTPLENPQIIVNGTVKLAGDLDIEFKNISMVNYTKQYTIIESYHFISGVFDDIDIDDKDSNQKSNINVTISSNNNKNYIAVLYFTPKENNGKEHMEGWKIALITISVVSIVVGFALVPYLYRKYRGYNTTAGRSFFKLGSNKIHLNSSIGTSDDILLNINEDEESSNSQL